MWAIQRHFPGWTMLQTAPLHQRLMLQVQAAACIGVSSCWGPQRAHQAQLKQGECQPAQRPHSRRGSTPGPRNRAAGRRWRRNSYSKLAPQLLLLWLKGAAMLTPLTRCACATAGWTVSARQVPDAVPRHQVQHRDGGHGAQCGAQPGTAGLDDGADGRHAQGAGADARGRTRVRGPDFSC